jgi:hypothetical protein
MRYHTPATDHVQIKISYLYSFNPTMSISISIPKIPPLLPLNRLHHDRKLHLVPCRCKYTSPTRPSFSKFLDLKHGSDIPSFYLQHIKTIVRIRARSHGVRHGWRIKYTRRITHNTQHDSKYMKSSFLNEVVRRGEGEMC